MRTIPEVVEDIKSVLNIAARAEEFTGENLTEIDEFANEILVIDRMNAKGVGDHDNRILYEIYMNNGDVLKVSREINIGNNVCYCFDYKGKIEQIIPLAAIHHIQYIKE